MVEKGLLTWSSSVKPLLAAASGNASQADFNRLAKAIGNAMNELQSHDEQYAPFYSSMVLLTSHFISENISSVSRKDYPLYSGASEVIAGYLANRLDIGRTGSVVNANQVVLAVKSMATGAGCLARSDVIALAAHLKSSQMPQRIRTSAADKSVEEGTGEAEDASSSSSNPLSPLLRHLMTPYQSPASSVPGQGLPPSPPPSPATPGLGGAAARRSQASINKDNYSAENCKRMSKLGINAKLLCSMLNLPVMLRFTGPLVSKLDERSPSSVSASISWNHVSFEDSKESLIAVRNDLETMSTLLDLNIWSDLDSNTIKQIDDVLVSSVMLSGVVSTSRMNHRSRPSSHQQQPVHQQTPPPTVAAVSDLSGVKSTPSDLDLPPDTPPPPPPTSSSPPSPPPIDDSLLPPTSSLISFCGQSEKDSLSGHIVEIVVTEREIYALFTVLDWLEKECDRQRLLESTTEPAAAAAAGDLNNKNEKPSAATATASTSILQIQYLEFLQKRLDVYLQYFGRQEDDGALITTMTSGSTSPTSTFKSSSLTPITQAVLTIVRNSLALASRMVKEKRISSGSAGDGSPPTTGTKTGLATQTSAASGPPSAGLSADATEVGNSILGNWLEELLNSVPQLADPSSPGSLTAARQRSTTGYAKVDLFAPAPFRSLLTVPLDFVRLFARIIPERKPLALSLTKDLTSGDMELIAEVNGLADSVTHMAPNVGFWCGKFIHNLLLNSFLSERNEDILLEALIGTKLSVSNFDDGDNNDDFDEWPLQLSLSALTVFTQIFLLRLHRNKDSKTRDTQNNVLNILKRVIVALKKRAVAGVMNMESFDETKDDLSVEQCQVMQLLFHTLDDEHRAAFLIFLAETMISLTWKRKSNSKDGMTDKTEDGGGGGGGGNGLVFGLSKGASAPLYRLIMWLQYSVMFYDRAPSLLADLVKRNLFTHEEPRYSSDDHPDQQQQQHDQHSTAVVDPHPFGGGDGAHSMPYHTAPYHHHHSQQLQQQQMVDGGAGGALEGTDSILVTTGGRNRNISFHPLTNIPPYVDDNKRKQDEQMKGTTEGIYFYDMIQPVLQATMTTTTTTTTTNMETDHQNQSDEMAGRNLSQKAVNILLDMGSAAVGEDKLEKNTADSKTAVAAAGKKTATSKAAGEATSTSADYVSLYEGLLTLYDAATLRRSSSSSSSNMATNSQQSKGSSRKPGVINGSGNSSKKKTMDQQQKGPTIKKSKVKDASQFPDDNTGEAQPPASTTTASADDKWSSETNDRLLLIYEWTSMWALYVVTWRLMGQLPPPTSKPKSNVQKSTLIHVIRSIERQQSLSNPANSAGSADTASNHQSGGVIGHGKQVEPTGGHPKNKSLLASYDQLAGKYLKEYVAVVKIENLPQFHLINVYTVLCVLSDNQSIRKQLESVMKGEEDGLKINLLEVLFQLLFDIKRAIKKLIGKDFMRRINAPPSNDENNQRKIGEGQIWDCTAEGMDDLMELISPYYSVQEGGGDQVASLSSLSSGRSHVATSSSSASSTSTSAVTNHPDDHLNTAGGGSSHQFLYDSLAEWAPDALVKALNMWSRKVSSQATFIPPPTSSSETSASTTCPPVFKIVNGGLDWEREFEDLMGAIMNAGVREGTLSSSSSMDSSLIPLTAQYITIQLIQQLIVDIIVKQVVVLPQLQQSDTATALPLSANAKALASVGLTEEAIKDKLQLLMGPAMSKTLATKFVAKLSELQKGLVAEGWADGSTDENSDGRGDSSELGGSPLFVPVTVNYLDRAFKLILSNPLIPGMPAVNSETKSLGSIDPPPTDLHTGVKVQKSELGVISLGPVVSPVIRSLQSHICRQRHYEAWTAFPSLHGLGSCLVEAFEQEQQRKSDEVNRPPSPLLTLEWIQFIPILIESTRSGMEKGIGMEVLLDEMIKPVVTNGGLLSAWTSFLLTESPQPAWTAAFWKLSQSLQTLLGSKDFSWSQEAVAVALKSLIALLKPLEVEPFPTSLNWLPTSDRWADCSLTPVTHPVNFTPPSTSFNISPSCAALPECNFNRWLSLALAYAMTHGAAGLFSLVEASLDWLNQCRKELQETNNLLLMEGNQRASEDNNTDVKKLVVVCDVTTTALSFLREVIINVSDDHENAGGSDAFKLTEAHKPNDELGEWRKRENGGEYEDGEGGGGHREDHEGDTAAVAELEETGCSPANLDEIGLCTFTRTRKDFETQHWYHCHTCNMVNGEGVCSVCAKVCHRGHDLSYSKLGSFFCDCGAKQDESCQALVKRGNGHSHHRPLTNNATSSNLLGKPVVENKNPKLIALLQVKQFTRMFGIKPDAIANGNKQKIRDFLKGSGAKGVCQETLTLLSYILPAISKGAESRSRSQAVQRRQELLKELSRNPLGPMRSERILATCKAKTQEGLIEKVKSTVSSSEGGGHGGVGGQSLMAVLNPNPSLQLLAVVNSQTKVSILSTNNLIRQAESSFGDSTTASSTNKYVANRLAQETMDSPVVSIAGDKDLLAVCCLKEVAVVVVSSTNGGIVDKIPIPIPLESNNVVQKAVWLPGGDRGRLAVVTGDFVNIYQIFSEPTSPVHQFLSPSGKIRDVSFAVKIMPRLPSVETTAGTATEKMYPSPTVQEWIMALSSAGGLYIEELTAQTLYSANGSFYMTNTLDLPQTAVEKDTQGASVHYSNQLRLLLVSYQNGKTLTIPLDDPSNTSPTGHGQLTIGGVGSSKGHNWASSSADGQSSSSSGAVTSSGGGDGELLNRWTELSESPGIFMAMGSAVAHAPYVFYITQDAVHYQSLRYPKDPPISKTIDFVVLERDLNQNQHFIVVGLCDDGSLTLFWESETSPLDLWRLPRTVNYPSSLFLSQADYEDDPILMASLLDGTVSGGLKVRSENQRKGGNRTSKKGNSNLATDSEALNSQNRNLSDTVGGSSSSRLNPLPPLHHHQHQQLHHHHHHQPQVNLPVDFFETTSLLSDIQFGGRDMLQVYNRDQLNARLLVNNLHVACMKNGSTEIEVENKNENMVVCGIRVEIGKMEGKTPSFVQVFGRKREVTATRARWIDFPFTRSEALSAPNPFPISFGPSLEGSHAIVIDSIKVYGKSKETYGWNAGVGNGVVLSGPAGLTGATLKPSNMNMSTAVVAHSYSLGSSGSISTTLPTPLLPEVLLMTAFQTLDAYFLAFPNGNDRPKSAVDLTTGTLCTPLSLATVYPAKNLLKRMFDTTKEYHLHKDSFLINFVRTSLKKAEEMEDPELFSFLLMLTRNMAVRRPENLLHFAGGGSPAAESNESGDTFTGSNLSTEDHEISPDGGDRTFTTTTNLVTSLLDLFWMFHRRIPQPPNSANYPQSVGSATMYEPKWIVWALVEIIDGYCKADLEYVPIAAKHYLKLLTHPDLTVTQAAKAALIQIFKLSDGGYNKNSGGDRRRGGSGGIDSMANPERSSSPEAHEDSQKPASTSDLAATPPLVVPPSPVLFIDEEEDDRVPDEDEDEDEDDEDDDEEEEEEEDVEYENVHAVVPEQAELEALLQAAEEAAPEDEAAMLELAVALSLQQQSSPAPPPNPPPAYPPPPVQNQDSSEVFDESGLLSDTSGMSEEEGSAAPATPRNAALLSTASAHAEPSGGNKENPECSHGLTGGKDSSGADEEMANIDSTNLTGDGDEHSDRTEPGAASASSGIAGTVRLRLLEELLLLTRRIQPPTSSSMNTQEDRIQLIDEGEEENPATGGDEFDVILQMNGLQAVSFMQILLHLVSNLNATNEVDKEIVDNLLMTLLNGMDFSEETSKMVVYRTPWSELFLLKLRFLSVLLSKMKSRKNPSDEYLAVRTALRLGKTRFMSFCRNLLRELDQNVNKNLSKVPVPAAAVAMKESTKGGSKTTNNILSSAEDTVDLTPFFTKQYMMEHNRDIFECYAQLIAEMALRLPYQLKKVLDSSQAENILSRTPCDLEKPVLHFDDTWQLILCDLVSCQDIPFFRRQARKLLLLIAGSKDSYRSLRDRYSFQKHLDGVRDIVNLCPGQTREISDPRRPLNFCYNQLTSVLEHLRNIWDVANSRVGNWQTYIDGKRDSVGFLLRLACVVDDVIAGVLLELILAAITPSSSSSPPPPPPPPALPSTSAPTLTTASGSSAVESQQSSTAAAAIPPQSASSKASSSSSRKSKSRKSDHHHHQHHHGGKTINSSLTSDAAGGTLLMNEGAADEPSSSSKGRKGMDLPSSLVERIVEDESELLVLFLRRFLLQSNVADRRWETHRLIRAMFKCCEGTKTAGRLMELLWTELWTTARQQGNKASLLVDLLGYFTVKINGGQKNEEKLITLSNTLLTSLLTQSQKLSTHSNASLYSQLSSVLDVDGHYLESNPCLVCNNPEVPMASMKLSSIKADSRFTTTSQVVKFTGNFQISRVTVKFTDIKRQKMVKSLRLLYCNKTVASAVELKNKPELWSEVKRLELTGGQNEVRADFGVPIVASSFLIQFESFYTGVSGAGGGEVLHCPRCSATVPPSPGLCNNCGENVFQCHKCRSINYDEKDPFLCTSCGFSKYAKFEVSFLGRQIASVETISNGEDKERTLALVKEKLDKAEEYHKQLYNYRAHLETTLSRLHRPTRRDTKAEMEGSSPIAAYIQDLAFKYSGDCRKTFTELSKIVQEILANRKELMEYDVRVGETPHPLLITTSYAQSSDECFGCAEANCIYILKILRGLLTMPAVRSALGNSETLIQLYSLLSSAPSGLASKLRELVCDLCRDNVEGTETVCGVIESAVADALNKHEYTHVLGLLIATQMDLLRSTLEIMDSCWERRLKTAMGLFLGSLGSSSVWIMSELTLPCLQMLHWLLLPPSTSGSPDETLPTGLSPEGPAPHSSDADKKLAATPAATTDSSHSANNRSSATVQPNIRSLYLQSKYGNKWLRRIKPSGCILKNELDANYDIEELEWLRNALFCRNSISLRLSASALFREIATSSAAKKAQVLDIVVKYLNDIGEYGNCGSEFMHLFKFLIEEPVWKYYLAIRGFLPAVANLLTQEVESLMAIEETWPGTDLNQGFAIGVLADVLHEMMKMDGIRQRWKSVLLGPVLNAYLALRLTLLQRTKLLEDAQDLLLLLLEDLTTGTEDERRNFMGICIETVEKYPITDTKTPLFIFERLSSIIYPEKKEVGEFAMNIEKDAAQEDFLQGRMMGNPYSSKAPGMGPTMKDIKNKICRDCELVALLDDDTGMELLVDGKIISLELGVADVYHKLWLVSNPNVPIMPIVYRMRGLLGDATEEFVETLDAKKDEKENDEETYKMAGVIATCNGLPVMLKRLDGIKSLTQGRELLRVLVKLFQYCLKVKSNRKALMNPALKPIQILLGKFRMMVESNELSGESVSVSENILELIGIILKEASQLPAKSFMDVAANFGTVDDIKWVLELETAETGGEQGGAGVTGVVSGTLKDTLMRTLPNLTLGSEERMNTLIQFYAPYLNFSQSDYEATAEHKAHLENLCTIAEGIQASPYGSLLKAEFNLRTNLLTEAVQSLSCLCASLSSVGFSIESPEWKQYLSRKGLKFILRILAGFCQKDEASQMTVAASEDCILTIHRLEQIATEERLGTIAENLMEALRENPTVAEKIEKVRKETKKRRKEMAMAVRQKHLKEIGVVARDEDGQVLVAQRKNAIMKDSEIVTEESGLACSICREGYTAQPTKLLAVYTFTKKCSADDGEAGVQSKTKAYSTVSHFNLVHVDCHLAAVRSARGREEWESAMLHNANTRCNGLLPLWGVQVPETSFAGCLARHNNYVQNEAQSGDITFRSGMQDLKLLLLRFADEKSFSEDSGGGGKESNMDLLPSLILLPLYLLNQARLHAAQEKLFKAFVQTPPSHWIPSSYVADGPLLMVTMAMVLVSPSQWKVDRLSLLKRLVVLAHLRHVHPSAGIDRLTDTLVKEFTVYRSVLRLFAIVDGYHNIILKNCKESSNIIEWASNLQEHLRDTKILEKTKELLLFFDEKILPQKTFYGLFSVLEIPYVSNEEEAQKLIMDTLKLVS